MTNTPPHTEHTRHEAPDGGQHDHDSMSGRSMALSATLHCLSGCAIGEIVGLMAGTAIGLSKGWTIALSIALAFVFGFTLSSLPLVKTGLTVVTALSVVLAADTVSIATMEVADNVVMAIIPGAMNAGLVNPVFWVGMLISLAVAFFAALPVNRYLLAHGKGHALTHKYHGATGQTTGARRYIPTIVTSTLVSALAAFVLGGLVVSIADDLASHHDRTATGPISTHQEEVVILGVRLILRRYVLEGSSPVDGQTWPVGRGLLGASDSTRHRQINLYDVVPSTPG